MICSIREAKDEDAQYVMDIDIKCFGYPWTPDFWADTSKTYQTLVATFYGTPVAMAVYSKGPVICPTFCYEAPEGVHTLLKVAVKEKYRRHGIGKMLVNRVKGNAYSAKSETLLAIVPESLCVPSSSKDASVWLGNCGFRAKQIIPACFTDCGEVEDGFLFESVLREAQ